MFKNFSHIKTEAIAGVTTFFTMAYIVIVNPAILSSPGTGMSFNGVLTATVLLSFTMTLFMGLYAKLPYASKFFDYPGNFMGIHHSHTVVFARWT